jgi:hypothetical protein
MNPKRFPLHTFLGWPVLLQKKEKFPIVQKTEVRVRKFLAFLREERKNIFKIH